MNPTSIRSFASDNTSGAHPEILRALAHANAGDAPAYGADAITERAVAKFRELLGSEVEVFFVFNGTAANVLGLQSLLKPHQAVICAEAAHIQVDECGAPERFTGSKLLPIAAEHGKLTVDAITRAYRGIGNPHHVQPAVVSVSQSTEVGTVYTPDELRALARFCHERGMRLHVDGARIANAAASLGASLRELVLDTGVDALSFGGTKNGMMFGEAVVLLKPELAHEFAFLRKQGMQLASKMRFVSAQFEALLTDDLWLRNARHANAMARRLEAGARTIPGVQLQHPVQANAVFAKVPRAAIARLQSEFLFYVWNEEQDVVRWVTSFDTPEAEVDRFLARLREAVAA